MPIVENAVYSPAVALHPFCGNVVYPPLSMPLKMSFPNSGEIEKLLNSIILQFFAH